MCANSYDLAAILYLFLVACFATVVDVLAHSHQCLCVLLLYIS